MSSGSRRDGAAARKNRKQASGAAPSASGRVKGEAAAEADAPVERQAVPSASTQPRTRRTRPVARPKSARAAEPVGRLDRIRSNPIAGHLSGMLGLMIVAVLIVGGVYLFMTMGPFAAPPTPGPLTQAEKATLGPKYQSIEATRDAKWNTAYTKLNDAVAGGNLNTIHDAFGGVYDVENEFLAGLNAVDWKGAGTEAKKLEVAVQGELVIFNSGKTAALSDVTQIVQDWSFSKTNLDVTKEALRNALGIPAPAPPTAPPSVTPGPAATPSGSTEASGSAAVSPSPEPSPSPTK